MRLVIAIFLFVILFPVRSWGYPFDVVKDLFPWMGGVTSYFSAVTIFNGRLIVIGENRVFSFKDGDLDDVKSFSDLKLLGVAAGSGDLIVAGIDGEGVRWYYRASDGFAGATAVNVGIRDIAYYDGRFWGIDDYGEVILLDENPSFYQSLPGSMRFVRTGGNIYVLAYPDDTGVESSVIYGYEGGRWVERGRVYGKILDLCKTDVYYALVVSGSDGGLGLFRSDDLYHWTFVMKPGEGADGLLTSVGGDLAVMVRGKLYINRSGRWQEEDVPESYKFFRALSHGNEAYLVGSYLGRVGIIGKIEESLNILYPSEVAVSLLEFYDSRSLQSFDLYPLEIYSFAVTSYGLRLMGNLILPHDPFLSVAGFFALDKMSLLEIGYPLQDFLYGKAITTVREIHYSWYDSTATEVVDSSVTNGKLRVTLCSTIMKDVTGGSNFVGVPVFYEYNGSGIWSPGSDGMVDLSEYGVEAIRAVACTTSMEGDDSRIFTVDNFLGVVNETKNGSQSLVVLKSSPRGEVSKFSPSSVSLKNFNELNLPSTDGSFELAGGNGRFFLYDGSGRLGVVSGPLFDHISWFDLPEEVYDIVVGNDCSFGFAVNFVYFACGDLFIFSNDGKDWHMKESDLIGEMRDNFFTPALWKGNAFYFVSSRGKVYTTVFDPIEYTHGYSVLLNITRSSDYYYEYNLFPFCFDESSSSYSYRKFELTNSGPSCFETDGDCIYIDADKCSDQRIWGDIRYYFENKDGSTEEYVAPVSIVVHSYPDDNVLPELPFENDVGTTAGCGCRVGGNGGEDILLMVLLIAGIFFITRKKLQ